jgi:orotidine-5'-phosphate decarboxylase
VAVASGGSQVAPATSFPASPISESVAPRDRLIFALDVPDHAAAADLVGRLGDSVTFYKLGLEFLLGGDYRGMVSSLRDRGKQVMVDLKMFDVPETVGRAVRQLTNLDASLTTVHGNDEMLAAAVHNKGDVKILAVTVLTSLDRNDLRAMGYDAEPRDLVLSRAKRALEIGCDGVVASGQEAAALRSELGEHFLIVTPGIRPVENKPADDQKRTVDVAQAFRNGADHIVVGRPIRDAPDPRAAAAAIQSTIASIFGE